MRQALIGALVALLGSLASYPATAQNTFSHPIIPQGFGVNIHFTHPQDGEMAMLAASGVKWVRMDLTWDSTEKIKGVYDFSAYDHLVKNLERHGLKAHFILDYGNPLYENGISPHREDLYGAFARWAVAAAAHFAGKGYLWEIWNEPNISHFWKPKPNSDHYLKLVRTVSRAFRKNLPEEILAAPALSRIDWGYLKPLVRGGLLDYIDVLSVHPYRNKAPETFYKDLKKIRALLDKYAPQGKKIPVISGEWGYPAYDGGVEESIQAAYLVRMWLGNLSNGVDYSIWYDWHDDGPEAHNPEHHFGIVKFPYQKGTYPPYQAKPSYQAAQFLSHQLKGFQYDGRENVGSSKDYLLRFRKGSENKWVYWTQRSKPRNIGFPTQANQRFLLQDMVGKRLKVLSHPQGKLLLNFQATPQYLSPQP